MKKTVQRKRITKVIAGVMSILLLLAAFPAQAVRAASATITISTDATEIHVGDTVEVKLKISADTTIGDFEAFLSYDDTVFEFYSAASCITGGAGFLKVSDIGASPSVQDRTYRLYFRALIPGECELALYERPIVYSYTDGTELSITGVSKTFSVLPSVSASNNSSLTALYLVEEHGTMVTPEPAFSTEQLAYRATVPAESDMVIVSAIAADASANVEVVGGTGLVIGSNEVQVIVTAEDGSKTVYTIEVYRSEQSKEPEATPVPESPVELPEAGLTFTAEGKRVWITEYHTYTIEERTEEMVLPEGYVEFSMLMNDCQIPVYARKDGTSPEFVLLVLKNEAGELNFYRYDRVEQTLQRVSEEEYIINQIVPQEEQSTQALIQQYEFHQSLLSFAIALMFGICTMLLVVIVWLCVRRKNRG